MLVKKKLIEVEFDSGSEKRIIGYKPEKTHKNQNVNDLIINFSISRSNPIDRVEHIYIRKQNSDGK